jgi:hypothetical protein
MLPSAWRPIPADDLLRLGAAGDGGYVVSRRSVIASSTLLSMGLNDDWRFEAAFRDLSGAAIICFDHSVNARFWMLNALKQAVLFRIGAAFNYFRYRRFFQGDVQHQRVKIGFDGQGETSLAAILKTLPDTGIFLKVDIEGAEYRIFDDIIANIDRFTGMVFEFHDIDLHYDRLVKFIDALRGFSIIGINGNNYGGVDANGDPLVVEMSFVRNDMIVDAQDSARRTAVEAIRNDPHSAPIQLMFEPEAA